MSEKKSTGWQNIRRQLDNWSKPALITLVKDLHEASPDNRDFLLARFQAEDDTGVFEPKYTAPFSAFRHAATNLRPTVVASTSLRPASSCPAHPKFLVESCFCGLATIVAVAPAWGQAGQIK